MQGVSKQSGRTGETGWRRTIGVPLLVLAVGGCGPRTEVLELWVRHIEYFPDASYWLLGECPPSKDWHGDQLELGTWDVMQLWTGSEVEGELSHAGRVENCAYVEQEWTSIPGGMESAWVTDALFIMDDRGTLPVTLELDIDQDDQGTMHLITAGQVATDRVDGDGDDLRTGDFKHATGTIHGEADRLPQEGELWELSSPWTLELTL